MGLTVYKVIPNCSSRGPIIIPAIPSFSKRGFDQYTLHCVFSRALDNDDAITEVNAYAFDRDDNNVSDTIIGTKEIGSNNQSVDIVVKSGTVALSDYKILVQVETATEQSELEITMTITADALDASGELQMAGALQMDGDTQMVGG